MYKYNISHILKQLRLDCGESCPRLSTILEKISENIFSAQDFDNAIKDKTIINELELFGNKLLRLNGINQTISIYSIEI